eukprot:747419-Hanusia_phi.AAC.4
MQARKGGGRWSMAARRQKRQALVLALLALSLSTSVSAASRSFTALKNVDDFEENVIKSMDVWLVLFVGMSNDEIKAKGIDREKCQTAIDQLGVVTEEMRKLSVQVAVADVDDLAGIASEFNVRKRMLPKILLFKTRARDADSIKFDVFQDVSALRNEVLELLKDNPRRAINDDGQGQAVGFDKITLAVGGSDLTQREEDEKGGNESNKEVEHERSVGVEGHAERAGEIEDERSGEVLEQAEEKCNAGLCRQDILLGIRAYRSVGTSKWLEQATSSAELVAGRNLRNLQRRALAAGAASEGRRVLQHPRSQNLPRAGEEGDVAE